MNLRAVAPILICFVSLPAFADDPAATPSGPQIHTLPVDPAPMSLSPQPGPETTITSPTPVAAPQGAIYSDGAQGQAAMVPYGSTSAYTPYTTYAGPSTSMAPAMPSWPASGCGCGAAAMPVGYGATGAGYGGAFAGPAAFGFHGGGFETYTGAEAFGMHVRHPYYSYRRPWYANGPMSHNVTIAW